MAVVNRTLDASQQRFVLEQLVGATATGVTFIVGQIPNPCVIDAAQFSAFGMSGAPTAQIVINRFIPGAGFTAINLGSANALRNYGVSGVLDAGASLPAAGSTLNNLLANDVIVIQTGGAASAVTAMAVNLVLRPIQDIKKFFGTLA